MSHALAIRPLTLGHDNSPRVSDDERDREWLRAWREGDKRSGNALMTAYFEPVRAYFFRRAPDDYEDLVQRTFLALAEAKDRFRGWDEEQEDPAQEGRRPTVRAFLFGIARKMYLKHLSTLARARKIDPYQSSVYELLGRRPSSLLAAQEEEQALLDALQEIPIEQQDLLELYYWQELSGPELAAMHECTERAVHGRLHRARERLRKLLAERGVLRSDEQLQEILHKTRQLQL